MLTSLYNYSMTTGRLAANELPLLTPAETPTSTIGPSIFTNPNAIAEDADDVANDADPNLDSVPPLKAPRTEHPAVPVAAYTWRIDLAKTETFWSGWFEGLSQKFLDLRVPKLLLLANIDGLDRTLTVGQMQGRFQLQVLARSGHVVHEDQPHEVAEIVAAYMLRNRFATAVGSFEPPSMATC